MTGISPHCPELNTDERCRARDVDKDDDHGLLDGADLGL